MTDDGIPIDLTAATVTIDIAPNELLINPPVLVRDEPESLPATGLRIVKTGGTFDASSALSDLCGGTLSGVVYYDAPTGAITRIALDEP